MVKKYLRRIGLSLLVLSVMACSSKNLLEKKYLGKQYNYKKLQKCKLTDSGHHLWKYKHLYIDYDYSIDHETNTIAFEGTIKFNPKYLEEQTTLYSLISSDCEVHVLFADKSGKIVAVELFYVGIGGDIYKLAPFKQTLPYDNSYCYVIFGYHLRWTAAMIKKPIARILEQHNTPERYSYNESTINALEKVLLSVEFLNPKTV